VVEHVSGFQLTHFGTMSIGFGPINPILSCPFVSNLSGITKETRRYGLRYSWRQSGFMAV
jgi:hypothetical protein